MRILIAEDDSTSRLMLTALLKKAGHEVIATANGAEAWEVLQQSDAPLLVILDYMMPAMDGLQVLRLVRANPTRKPPYIIMLTVKSKKADIIAGLDAGADDYLLKPFDAGELQARVEVGRRMIEIQSSLEASLEELRQALDQNKMLLQQAFDQIKTLRGIVPICAYCKKIRDDKGYWSQVEKYVSEHTDAKFSHGICPQCLERELKKAGE